MRRILLALLPLLLSACATAPDRAPEPVSSATQVEWRRVAPGCQGDDCAYVRADYPRYPGQPELDRAVREGLAGIAVDVGETNTASASPEAYATRFLAIAARIGADDPRWASELSARELRRTSSLVVLELDAYVYTGGAHGMPTTRYLIFDLRDRRALGLDDLLLPGRRDAFEQLAREAHADWAKRQFPDDPGFTEQWAFSLSDNVAPLTDGLTLKYDVYAIAPYSEGQPELVIPYSRLDGILDPRWLQ
ncbi:RsiV family protein [Halotalea alkalilenta]|uniref:RsiV family protein n=1 Tax=Halotalea alkalilenta TaxID=376489 RepID=UPI0004834EA7|nr:RsiV family protein [Halotalea alkalilenta]